MIALSVTGFKRLYIPKGNRGRSHSDTVAAKPFRTTHPLQLLIDNAVFCCSHVELEKIFEVYFHFFAKPMGSLTFQITPFLNSGKLWKSHNYFSCEIFGLVKKKLNVGFFFFFNQRNDLLFCLSCSSSDKATLLHLQIFIF